VLLKYVAVLKGSMACNARFGSIPSRGQELLFSVTRLFLHPLALTAGRSCPAVKLSTFEFHEKSPDRNLYQRLLSDG
jgi:hypothetical protein